MFKLDNDFLTSLGLGGLPVDEKNKLLQMIYERLEMNVGMRLAEKMTDQQLDEFEAFIDQNDEAGALKWLETNFPNYKDVVAEELEKLKVEVTQAAPQILAAQGGAPGLSPVPPVMTEPTMPGVPEPFDVAQGKPTSSMPSRPAFQQPFGPPQQPGFSQPTPQSQPAYGQQPFGPPQQPGFTPPAPPVMPQYQPPVPMQSASDFTPPPAAAGPQPAPGFQQPQPPSQPPFDPAQGKQFNPPPPAGGFTSGQ